MNKELKSKILKDLKQSGFPLQVETAAYLQGQGWKVDEDLLYVDEESDKERSVDIHALKVDYTYASKTPKRITPGNENKLIAHLVIECKKSTKPWIFFDNGKVRWPIIPSTILTSKYDDFNNLMFEELETYGLKEHRYKNAKFHKSFYQAIFKGDEEGRENKMDDTKIRGGLYQATKASRYLKQRYGVGEYSFHLFHPVVVLEGELCSASVGKPLKTGGYSVKIKAADIIHVVFNRLVSVDPSEKAGFFEEEQVVDIVRASASRKYLRLVEKDNKALHGAWTKFHNSSRRVKPLIKVMK